MAQLFDKEFTRADLLERVGEINQLGGVRIMRLEEGRGEGVRLIEARTGTGFRFNILPSRGMDVSFAEYKGIPLSWRSCTGDVSPAFYEPEGDEWHRLFYGGMVITCGLSNVGPSCVDQGEPLVIPGHLRVMTVPGNAGCRVDYSVPAPCYAVEQGRLADIRSADQGDKGGGIRSHAVLSSQGTFQLIG